MWHGRGMTSTLQWVWLMAMSSSGLHRQEPKSVGQLVLVEKADGTECLCHPLCFRMMGCTSPQAYPMGGSGSGS